jgi:protein-S-isoprenylcysteine O-methyltransferase Ste14
MRRTWSALVGRPPIHPVLFALSKVAMVVAWGVASLRLFGVRPSPGWRSPVALEVFALVLVAVSLLLFVFASRSLGPALRIGLPRDDTQLATSGVYRFSRHPIYLAVFLMSFAACLLFPHPVVIGSALVAGVLHHRIAMAEEAFLEARFGEAWRMHQARVPRYLGWKRLRDRDDRS